MLKSSYWCNKCQKYYTFEEKDISMEDAMEMDESDMPERLCKICKSKMMFDEIF